MTPTEENVYVVKNGKKTKLENGADLILKIREEYTNKTHIICPSAYYYSDFFTKILDEIFFSSSLCKKSSVESDKIEENNKWKELLNNVLRSSNPEVKTIIVNGKEQALSFEGLVENYFTDKIDKMELKKYVNAMIKHLTAKVKETWKKNNIFADDVVDIDKVDIEITYYDKTGEISLSISLKNEDEEETPLKDKSLGFRWYFTFLLFTLYRKSNNVLFLLDEPASNLYADIQENLFNCFKKLVKKDETDNIDAFIIYSTHSLYLLDDDIEEATHVVIKYRNDGMKCIKKEDIKEGTPEYDSLRVITDHKKCRMPFKSLENTLFVEGKEDYCIINLFRKILKNRLQNLFIYYVGGSGNFNQYIKCVIEKKFLVLLDNDNGGDNGYNNLKKEFNFTNIEKNVKMLNSIDVNFADIQSLIVADDKKKLCEIANTKYQDNDRNHIKLSVQKAIYELLIKTTTDKNNIISQLNQQLSQQTKDNFTKLADAIEKHFKLK